jgi:hypothetical protein
MSDTDEQPSGLLLAADHLEWWTDSLPVWSDDGREPWYEFLERRYRAEVALIERLHRAPRCWLEICPRRMDVELTLGGISVRTKDGLAAALREWARRAREQSGP